MQVSCMRSPRALRPFVFDCAPGLQMMEMGVGQGVDAYFGEQLSPCVVQVCWRVTRQPAPFSYSNLACQPAAFSAL